MIANWLEKSNEVGKIELEKLNLFWANQYDPIFGSCQFIIIYKLIIMEILCINRRESAKKWIIFKSKEHTQQQGDRDREM